MKNFYLRQFACAIVISGILTPEVKLFAGNDNFPFGARASGMGNAAVTLCNVWANFYNQGNLAILKNTCIGIHHEMDFGIKQLSTTAIAIAKPVGGGTIGLCSGSFGYSGFRENKTGLSYALKLFRGVYAGIQLEYLSMRSADNSPKYNAFTFEVGILADLNKELQLGVHVFNPANIHYYGKGGEPIPPLATLGFGYKPLESLIITVETEEKLGLSPIFRAGIEFGFGKSFLLRTGISSANWENSFGAGFKLKSIIIDLSLRRNPMLGYSPACSISYEFP
jgi:hypothetical protein